jgi:hypothetical protein
MALGPPLLPGVVNEDPSHGLARRGQEVGPAGELGPADEPEVGFVDQGGRLEGVTGRLGREL